ncbi:hypothetical protein AKJ51_01845 [candidate division MSBL1 archaeon SCGC-AAA382A20]|uniref:Uncharacterized protein n=1 Tax=candidate division MSBL1 archaeon SCGC-AAA382A20 TaxID=1698280 RepID=A0A133VLA8_9EURY|nr:hypothetical protein AKJ51_01845 [candidate division MSBL1 archaeon SCGC-AAA382A20]
MEDGVREIGRDLAGPLRDVGRVLDVPREVAPDRPVGEQLFPVHDPEPPRPPLYGPGPLEPLHCGADRAGGEAAALGQIALRDEPLAPGGDTVEYFPGDPVELPHGFPVKTARISLKKLVFYFNHLQITEGNYF